jgi:HK97 family phage prohead protease
MKKKEQFFIKNAELRAENLNNKKTIIGIIPYNSKSLPIGYERFIEIIDRTAFNKVISDNTNVYALYNHDDSKVLGSIKANTLQLENTDEGLVCTCELPNTSYGNDVWELVSRGDATNLSFGFSPVKTESGKNNIKILKEVKLHEISFCVPFAAYPETNSQTYLRGFMKRNIDIESINEILEKEELTEEEIVQLQDAVDTITKIIEKNKPSDSEKEAVNKEQREGTPKENTPDDIKVKEEVKQEILSLINTLFEIEKEGEEENNE